MKLDEKSRILIPDFIRQQGILEKGKVYYIIFESYNNILISDIPKGKVIGETKIDNNWRLLIPKRIVSFFYTTEVLVYCQNSQVGIIFGVEST